MGSYTYPIKHLEGTLTEAQIHQLLSRPSVIAKRVATLVEQRFISDYLLQGRYNAQGGGVFYENGEPLLIDDRPEAVAPGARYKKVVLSSGDIDAARTVKWGLGTDITDEKISREGISHVNRGLSKLGNAVIAEVDSVGMAVIAAKVTSTDAAAGAWTAPGVIAESLLEIAGTRAAAVPGTNLDTVVLKPAQHAKILGIFIDKGVLPREVAGNPVLTGLFPVDAFGFTWVTSPHYTAATPMLIDRDGLGGVADEKIASPEFASAGGYNIEVASDRVKGGGNGADKYELRARRVCVPVVTDPWAGVSITGTGLS